MRSDQKPFVSWMPLVPALALLSGACDSDGSGKQPIREEPTSTFVPGECPTEEETAECGTIEVPEDHAFPDGPKLTLAVARYRSGNPDAEPVVYLSGGPGSSGLFEVAALLDRFAPILAHRDVIVVDQRGTGFSVPGLYCDEFFEDDAPSALRDCRDDWMDQVDLANINTRQNALDVRMVMRSLGIRSFHAFGVSYGTRLALEMMRFNRGELRSVVLDSALPPDVDVLSESPAALQRSLRQVFATCRADHDCNNAYPALEGRFYALLQKLDEANDGGPSGVDLAEMLHGLLYSAEGVALVPKVIADAEAGDTSDWFVGRDEFEADGKQELREQIASAMYLSVVCSEWAPLATPSSIASLTSGLHADIVAAIDPNEILKLCDEWNVPARPAAQLTAVHSSVPTLVLAGAYDPATPPAWGERVAATLSNARLSHFAGASHGVFTSECGAEFVSAFMRSPNDVAEPVCAERDKPVTFRVRRRDDKTRAPYDLRVPSRIPHLGRATR